VRASHSGRGLHHVPAELTSFVGRRRELAEIKQRLGASRLVTLTGSGGVGKTRLALRAAIEMARAFPDGVWFVRLAPIEDPQLLTQAVYHALGLQDRSAGWSLTTLTDHLASKQLLMILDNCEHVIDSCAVLAGTLLESCSQLWLLATSRQALGIEGEVRMRVPSLSLPEDGAAVSAERLLDYDAVALLAERAAAVQPDFTIDERNRAEVLRLCRRLDGVPLALELAAVRLEGMGLRELNSALDVELSVLGQSSRRTETRQQTLEATIGWSYRLLNEQERKLWARLSVFAGGFGQDAVAQVCTGPDVPKERILSLLAALVEKSILKRDTTITPTRYLMLETLRQYGRQRLSELGEEIEIRARHRDWIVELSAPARPWDHRQAEVFDLIYLERDNLWAALDFCLHHPGETERGIEICRNLYVYWQVRGPIGDARRTLASLCELTADDSLSRGEGLWVGATLAVVQNDFDAAEQMLKESLRIGRLVGDLDVIGQSTLYLGVIAWVQGRLEEAAAQVRAALELARPASPSIAIGALNMQASLAMASGRPDQVIDPGEEALALSRESGELWVRGMLLNALSLARWQQGESHLAEALARESVATKHALHDGVGLAINVESLAMMAVERGAAERAAILLGCAEHLRESVVAPVFGPYQAQHDRSVSSARRQLGDAAYLSAFERGKAMTVDEAAAYALNEKPTRAPRPRAAAAVESPIPLTRRERQIAALVADGLSNKQIAAKLVISERTAENHILNILNKLGFNSRTQIASWSTAHQPVAAAPKG